MLKCAFYEKEITPPLGCHIPGYFSLRAATDVKDRLYARAMVIKSDDETVAIISVDACTVDAAILNPVKARLPNLQVYLKVISYLHILIATLLFQGHLKKRVKSLGRSKRDITQYFQN